MFAAFGIRHIDVLKELHDSLHSYVRSGQRLVDHLSSHDQTLLGRPQSVIRLINEHYRGGVLQLHDIIPTPCLRGPEVHYVRVKEAGQCIAEALRGGYGIQKKATKKKNKAATGSLVALNPFDETEAEKMVKRELRWVFSAAALKKELKQLQDNFKYVAANKSTFPSLNAYAAFSSFDRRIRPFMLALELEVLPPERVVGRVEHFLRTLYRKADKMLAVEDAKRNKKE